MQKSSLATFVLVMIAIGVSGLQAIRMIQDAGLGAAIETNAPASPSSAPADVETDDRRTDDAPRVRAEPDLPAYLPAEARVTIDSILRGGPFEYRQDGSVFQNRERNLPDRPRGYYREYTVVTPGSRDRGARRIVSGDDPPTEFFYTDDHYASFRRFVLGGRE